VIEASESPQKNAAAGRANWVHFVFSGVVLLGCVAFYEGSQAEALRRDIAQFRHENAILRADLATSEHSFQQAMSGFHQELNQFHADLAAANAETGQHLAVAQEAAKRHAEDLVGKLEKKRRQQEELQRQLTAELNRVKASTDETSTRLNGISSYVGKVKSEVDSVRTVAREANAGLQRMSGDMGIVSGFVATNADEIDLLRALGDRNVYEFTLTKTPATQRVGDIQVTLTRTDPKRNRFTVELVAADQRVEKRDKSINEPVQFYVPGKGSQPYELVVNEVGKNTIKGYLATPKMTVARNETEAAN
jgi:hypothetical protein